MKRSTTTLGTTLVLSLTIGCGHDLGSAMEMGVTQGGVQDINLAREIIESGGIPDQSQFRAEGLFSQHDLPLSGEECDLTLCPRTAVSRVNRADGSGDSLMVQIGFGSNIDMESFERRPQNIAVAIDISGSMGTDKMEAAKTALLALVDQLDERDTLSIIAFDDTVEVISSARAMDESGRERTRSRIERLRSVGGTNIEAGLERAFESAAENAGQPGIDDRVMLMTDAQPNVGATGVSSFMGLTRHYAEEGIGLSVFGVGMDLGAELATQISTVRGANSFFLADNEEIAQVFDEDFDFIVTPIAYDLEVDILVDSDWNITEGYGIAMDSPGVELEFGASTLFLSRRNGGMAAVLDHVSGVIPTDSNGTIGNIAVTFERADGSGSVEKDADIRFDGGEEYVVRIEDETIYAADQNGVFRMAVLVDEYLALTAAAEACDDMIDVAEARWIVGRAIERLEQAALEDLDHAEELNIELELMQTLSENLDEPLCH